MTISVLIPCYNEELSIAKSLDNWLAQTRPLDEILVVDDKSTDRSAEIIKSYGNKVKLITLDKNAGNKSFVQQAGLKHINTDIFIATDADTFPDRNFVSRVESAFNDPQVTAFAGHVKSLKKNWLTACREMEYSLGQGIHKSAQSQLGFIYVIPGCASAFRTDYFKKYIHFDHDTVTEDLDFTYKLNYSHKKVVYDSQAIVYTQDPATIKVYVNQMRRWYGGGWQNLVKHIRVLKHPIATIEISLMFFDAPFYFFFLYILPFINLHIFSQFIGLYLISITLMGLISSLISHRLDLLLYSPTYLLVSYINSYIFIEQFVKEIVIRKKQLTWYHPERWQISK